MVREEEYWGEQVPLRWLSFEEAKVAEGAKPLMTLEEVHVCDALKMSGIKHGWFHISTLLTTIILYLLLRHA